LWTYTEPTLQQIELLQTSVDTWKMRPPRPRDLIFHLSHNIKNVCSGVVEVDRRGPIPTDPIPPAPRTPEYNSRRPFVRATDTNTESIRFDSSILCRNLPSTHDKQATMGKVLRMVAAGAVRSPHTSTSFVRLAHLLFVFSHLSLPHTSTTYTNDKKPRSRGAAARTTWSK
jgi:hypothetical protein